MQSIPQKSEEIREATSSAPVAGDGPAQMTEDPIFVPELTVNWHIREECNFSCNFCYAKFAQRSAFTAQYPGVLRELATLPGKTLETRPESISAGRIRLNFAGGEPFLEKKLGSAIELAHNLGLSPSFITNGSLLTDDFIRRFGPMISVAGFSIDSFQATTNQAIGRASRRGLQVGADNIERIFDLFRMVSPRTTLKINTVVCPENVTEDLRPGLARLAPHRWKLLRVIPIHGAQPVTDAEFAAFVARHDTIRGAVVEDNCDMHRSYLMIDPAGRFYQREGSEYLRTKPIADVGAQPALSGVEFDAACYLSRY